MKKIVITGGLGFLGLNIIKDLRTNLPDIQISVVNRSDKELSYHNFELINKSVETITIDDIDFSDTDAIILLAGISNKGSENFELYQKINVEANQNIIQIAQSQNSQARIIFASTQAVYKTCIDKTENAVIGKTDDNYTNTKVLCEDMIKESIGNNNGLTYTIFRISNPFGVHIPTEQKYNYANQLLLDLYYGKTIDIHYEGKEIKNYIPVRNLTYIFRKTIIDKLFINEIVNMGHYKDVMLKDFYSDAISIFKTGELRSIPGSAAGLSFDTTKLYQSIDKTKLYSHQEELLHFKQEFDTNNRSIDMNYFFNL